MDKKLRFILPTKVFKNEAEFTRRFGREIHAAGGFRHKISDMSIDAKPCDAIIGFNGLLGLVEIKVGKEKTRVNVHSKLRPCQAYGLSQYKKNGGTSIVVYYNQIFHQYWVMEYDEQLLLSLTK